jgi:hypothetical protein
MNMMREGTEFCGLQGVDGLDCIVVDILRASVSLWLRIFPGEKCNAMG